MDINMNVSKFIDGPKDPITITNGLKVPHYKERFKTLISKS